MNVYLLSNLTLTKQCTTGHTRVFALKSFWDLLHLTLKIGSFLPLPIWLCLRKIKPRRDFANSACCMKQGGG